MSSNRKSKQEQHPAPEGNDDASMSSGFDHSEAISGGDDTIGSSGLSKEQETELAKITQKENKAVFWLRMLLVGVLLVCAVVVAILVHKYSRDEEENAFHAQFESDSHKMFEAIGNNFDLTMGAADAFMFRLVSQGHSTNSTWPFVTIPDLAVQTAKLLGQTKSIYVAMMPFITKKMRPAWENFTRYNDGWVEKALEVQSRNPDFHGPIIWDYNVSHIIWDNSGLIPEDAPGPFQPSWMGSPAIPYYYPYNWNPLAYPKLQRAYNFTQETKTCVVNSVANHANPNDPAAVAQAKVSSNWAVPYLAKGEDPTEPISEMYYPVIDDISDVVIRPKNGTAALGVVTFTFYWRWNLKNTLPPNSKGLITVFENTCGNQKFTYQIDGKEPTFLGYVDAHDENYDGMSHAKHLVDLSNINGDYTGLPMNGDFCPYTITMYPSKAMEDMFLTSAPNIYAIVVAMIFFFTSILFLSYDWFVNRRQRLVKERALASGAIISSLFPEQVRNQLYQESEAKTEKKTDMSQFKTATHAGNNANTKAVGKPNASLYPETTIFFADLVGFTAWSGTRTPVEVFELLETIYGEFDKLAARRRVFKVETIGDCYVAVTGIPEPQENHAVIMCKFAYDCLEKLPIVTRELAEKLGEDTKTLNMRIGLHSGSTTAGVLRGLKGRFQLFGDTVNTASRMESNGVSKKIHVSQATADVLARCGKHHWLSPREDKITVKGKGEMQTYFVTVKSNRNTSSTGSGEGGTKDSTLGESTVSDDESGDPEDRRRTVTSDGFQMSFTGECSV